MDDNSDILGNFFEALSQPSPKDKYSNKAIRFLDKNTHYELIFTDEFPSSGRFNSVITDILIDLKEAVKTKELHIFINSIGGVLTTLTALMQQIREFEYIVTVVMGEADSAGFMLWALGDEKYCSKYSQLMYHSASTLMEGKLSELANYSEHMMDSMQIIAEELHIEDLLTKEEIEKGEHTEVWISGKELINRGKAKDYSEYVNREILKGVLVIDMDNMLLKQNPNTHKFEVYLKEDEAKDFTYYDIRKQLMNKDITYEDILKPESIAAIKQANAKNKKSRKRKNK